MAQIRLKTLYFAPDPGIRYLRRNKHIFEITTCDLKDPGADITLDITRMDLESHSFDLIVCSHVLEHVYRDDLALAELFRVLKPAGLAILQFPYRRSLKETDEDPSVTDPSQRSARFGQFDHVRIYGRDVKRRMERAGFTVFVWQPVDEMEEIQRTQFGLWEDTIFLCCKDAVSAARTSKQITSRRASEQES